MFRISAVHSHRIGVLSAFLVLISGLQAFGQIDKSKYITVDEIKPGMKAYCLTVYKGVKIEKFELTVLDVVWDIRPGKNAILVIGTDERFVHTGPVSGCSGSPVYIDGRLAGALAFGWTFSKDALYGVTPIEEMLRVGTGKSYSTTQVSAMAFDFSKPIVFSEIMDKMAVPSRVNSAPAGASFLSCPLVTSLPQIVCDKLSTDFEPFGLTLLAGGPISTGSNGKMDEYKDIQLAPGSILASPLISGDIEASVIGTVTEVVGEKIYGFGHSFLGYGEIDLPMATGYVHTVVANAVRSFKFGQSIDVKGALRADESTAIYGLVGAKAKTIPLRITIERYNDNEIKTYNCQLAVNHILTPSLVRMALLGTSLMRGALPAEHMIEYEANIAVKDHAAIKFKNISTSMALNNIIAESVGSVAILMNNPYKKFDITSMDFNIRIVPKNITSHIWSVDISDTTVKPGQMLDVSIILESYLSPKKRYNQQIKIPDYLKPGRYKLVISGSNDYQKFLRNKSPYRFIPENAGDIISIINDITNMRRNRLYVMLILPKSGIAIERAILPDLPPSKVLLLMDHKRTLQAKPVTKWIEESISIESIVIDKKIIEITVEE